MGGRGASSGGRSGNNEKSPSRADTIHARRIQANRNRLDKGIRSFQKRVREHRDKIGHPEKYVRDWDRKSPREQEGLRKHWQKEIEIFENNIRKATTQKEQLQ